MSAVSKGNKPREIGWSWCSKKLQSRFLIQSTWRRRSRSWSRNLQHRLILAASRDSKHYLKMQRNWVRTTLLSISTSIRVIFLTMSRVACCLCVMLARSSATLSSRKWLCLLIPSSRPLCYAGMALTNWHSTRRRFWNDFAELICPLLKLKSTLGKGSAVSSRMSNGQSRRFSTLSTQIVRAGLVFLTWKSFWFSTSGQQGTVPWSRTLNCSSTCLTNRANRLAFCVRTLCSG